MSIQLTFDQLLPPVVSPGEGTLPERFAAFHAANPHVYYALRRLALQMRRAGVRRCGMKMLFEVLRWQYKLQTQGDEYRLNNVYTAFYARLLMSNEPELQDFFETRKAAADE